MPAQEESCGALALRGAAAPKGAMPRRSLAILGIVHASFLLLWTCLSYGVVTLTQLPTWPFSDRTEPNELSAYTRLGHAVGNVLAGFLAGKSIVREEGVRALALAVPAAGATITAVVLLALLARHRITKRTVSAMYAWAVVFAVISVPAAPAMVQDFWLSPAWGQMVVRGANPYYQDMTPGDIGQLPLDFYPHMTYGPLWALLSAALVWIGGTNVVVVGLVFKVVLGACWVGSVTLIQRLLVDRGPRAQAIGIAVFGWMPLSVMCLVAEGHNDVCMIALVLGWVLTLEQGRYKCAAALLAASVCVKYVTLPLFLVHCMYMRRSRGQEWRAIAGSLVPAVIVCAASFAPFFRSMKMFEPMTHMARWRFLTPDHAVYAVGVLIRPHGELVIRMLARGVRIMFVGTALYALWVYWRKGSGDEFIAASLAILCAVLFAFTGHVWPWFVPWVLAFAALSTWRLLARWAVSVGICAWFLIVPWALASLKSNAEYVFYMPALGVYGAALCLTVWLGGLLRDVEGASHDAAAAAKEPGT